MDAVRGILIGVAACSQLGCAAMWAGAGAAGAAGAYEARNKQELEQLDDEYESGKIDQQEYGTRKDAVEDRSLVY